MTNVTRLFVLFLDITHDTNTNNVCALFLCRNFCLEFKGHDKWREWSELDAREDLGSLTKGSLIWHCLSFGTLTKDDLCDALFEPSLIWINVWGQDTEVNLPGDSQRWSRISHSNFRNLLCCIWRCICTKPDYRSLQPVIQNRHSELFPHLPIFLIINELICHS